MVNQTEDALGREQTDSHQYMMFPGHSHPCVNQIYMCDFSLTADEQFMPLKTRCPFITFMLKKPRKCGIKLRVLVDKEIK